MQGQWRWPAAMIAALGCLTAALYVTRPRAQVAISSGVAGPVLTVTPHGWLRIERVVVEGTSPGSRVSSSAPWVSLAGLATSTATARVVLHGYAWGLWPYDWQTTVRLARAPTLLSTPPFITDAEGWLLLRWSAPLSHVRVPAALGWQLTAGGTGLRIHLAGAPGTLQSVAVAVSGKNTVVRTLTLTVQHPPWLTASVSPSGLLGAQEAVTLHWNQPVGFTPAHLSALRWIPATAGRWQPLDSRVWRFLPAQPWVQGRTYTLVITPASTLRSTLGMPLRQPLIWQFVGALALARLYWLVPHSPHTVYVTFDGGQQVDPAVLELMRSRHLPFTAFLSGTAASAHPRFWAQWLADGGNVGDGTYDRRPLTGLDFASVVREWSQALATYPAGAGPVRVGRPPGGLYNDTVRMAATAAGLRALVLWSAVLSPDGHIETWNGKPLAGGEIVRVEWSPSVATAVRRLLAVAAARHLRVGNLVTALVKSPG